LSKKIFFPNKKQKTGIFEQKPENTRQKQPAILALQL